MARDDFPKTKTMEGHEGVDTSNPGGDGTVTTSPAAVYYAYCSGSPSHQGAWTGQDCSVRVDAQRECDDHNTWCDTHSATVQSRPASA